MKRKRKSWFDTKPRVVETPRGKAFANADGVLFPFNERDKESYEVALLSALIPTPLEVPNWVIEVRDVPRDTDPYFFVSHVDPAWRRTFKYKQGTTLEAAISRSSTLKNIIYNFSPKTETEANEKSTTD
jgi:hypothetical protein